MRFVPLSDKHWVWIKERIDLTLMSNTKGVAAEKEDGTIMGVCVCDSWTYSSVQLHVAIDNPIILKNGRFLREVFGYVFTHADRQVALGLVPAKNEKALKFDRKLGFVEIFRIKQGYAEDEDMVILELRKENCKWIGGKHG